ncbi:MAG: hypothetical protein H7641_06745 [Candidatus Heimdallarchaeota archaeon]|nr:hypothetical protein [Candidatus Heimdallarchaeota archaeon]MCK4877262.1 hypothetical protein [Candidatus Heimdallarchaeota archaeon]
MSKKNQVPQEKWKYFDVVEYLLSQQFFAKPDFIIDRRASKRMKIKGSGAIMNDMILKIKEHSTLFEKGKDEEFMDKIASELNIRTKSIHKQYSEKMSLLEDVQKDDKKFKMMIILSVLISHLHKKNSEMIHKKIRDEIVDGYSKKDFNNAMGLLYQTSDEDLSLLQNIAVLKNFARLTKHNPPVKEYQKKKKIVLKKIKKSLKEI